MGGNEIIRYFIAYPKNNSQKNKLDKLFDYSNLNPNSISFSQKRLADGDRFIVKIKNIDSVSKAIKVLEDINT